MNGGRIEPGVDSKLACFPCGYADFAIATVVPAEAGTHRHEHIPAVSKFSATAPGPGAATASGC